MRMALIFAAVLSPIGAASLAGQPQLVFEDHLTAELGTGWTWLCEERAGWRFSANGLQIRVQPGKADTVKNALVREVPPRGQDTWFFEVSVTNLSHPIQQYEQAGLTWYHDGKPILKLVKELVDGKTVIVPGKIPIAQNTVRLRLIVQGQRYRAQFMTKQSREWRETASGTLPAAGKDQISLQCYDGPANAEHWILFEDFRVLRAVDGAPLPGKK